MRPTITIRVDADAQIGLGHLKRCLTLAGELRAAGAALRLVCRRHSDQRIEQIARGFPVCRIAAPASRHPDERAAEDAQRTLTIIGRSPAEVSWVVVDHYELAASWERRIRAAGHRILAIDDFRGRRHCADILVGDCPLAFAELDEHPPGGVQLVGPEYALIASDYAPAAGAAGARPEVKRVLVAYGGADPTGETAKALAALSRVRPAGGAAGAWRIDVVIGPVNARSRELAELAHGLAHCSLHLAPETLAPLMRAADLVLASGGNTMLEAVAMRKPCLITATADNQALTVGYLAERGAIIPVGAANEVQPTELGQRIEETIADYEQVRRRVQAAACYDCHGARRIAAAMRDHTRQRGGSAMVETVHERP